LIVPVDGSGKLRLRPLHSDLQPAARTDFFDQPLGEFQIAFLRDREFDFMHCCDAHILGVRQQNRAVHAARKYGFVPNPPYWVSEMGGNYRKLRSALSSSDCTSKTVKSRVI